MKRLFAGCLFAVTPVQAQTPSDWSLSRALDAPDALKLSGSVRLRYETIDGQPRPTFNDTDDLVNLRTTLSAEYKAGPVRFGAELYDSRIYEARVRYWLIPNTLRAEVNGVWLVKGRFLKTAPNAPRNGNTRYLSLNLTALF